MANPGKSRFRVSEQSKLSAEIAKSVRGVRGEDTVE